MHIRPGSKLSKAGQVAVITGAGGGLGRALAVALAGHGWKLALGDIDTIGCEGTGQLVRQAGGQALTLTLDTASSESMAAFATAVFDGLGHCDLLINNAGVGVGGLVGETTLEDWEHAIGVNLMGPVRGCHHFVPAMKARGSGHIVNISSLAAFANPPRMAPYNVSKAGLVALSETLAAELAGSGIGVTVVCPAFFKSQFHTSFRVPATTATAGVERLIASSPVTSEQIAAAVLRAVERGQLYLVPGLGSRLVWRLRRFVPGLMTRLSARLMRRLEARR